MKKPEEIKKGLWCCHAQYSASCGECPYSNDCRDCGTNGVQIMKDALALIQQLEAENSRKDDTIRNLTELLNAAHDETAAVRRERDALKSDLFNAEPCFTCLHFRHNGGDCGGGSACREAMWEAIVSNREYTGNVYEWRGVCPENTEVQEDAAE